MLSDKYIVIIPAYNEQSTIIDCLEHVLRASTSTKGYNLDRIIVCINGCTDDTETLVRGWSGAPVTIISSRPGYIHAMNRLFSYAKKHHPTSIMVKTDADGVIHSDAFSILFRQLKLHPDIIIAGGHPVPLPSTSNNFYRRFMSRLLSVRSRTPEAEVSVADTHRFHPYATLDPIPELNGREEKLKVYFHGRFWCARSAQAIPLLPRGVIGDDVYLPAWLVQHYGYGSMRVDYRARVGFHPNDSLVRHWKVYRRIYEDRKLVYDIDGFDEYAKSCPLKLDWKYILASCKLREAMYFMLYTALVRIEKISYRFGRYDTTYWQYTKKEV